MQVNGGRCFQVRVVFYYVKFPMGKSSGSVALSNSRLDSVALVIDSVLVKFHSSLSVSLVVWVLVEE